MNEFVLVFSPGEPLLFRGEDDASREWFQARPRLMDVVRALVTAYALEGIDECTTIVFAKDLERSLRIVSGEAEIRVTAMRYELREAGRYRDPWTGRTTALVTKVLAEIPAEAPASLPTPP